MTAHKHILPQSIAFAAETTPCEAPADWTAETAIEFISVDLSNVKETLVEDPTAERREFAVKERPRVKGLRNCSASIVCKLHGVGAVTAATQQVTNTYLAKLLKHCLGHAVRGYSTTINGPGTSTVPIVTATTGIIPGVILWFEDVTDPDPQNEGVLHPRRVLSVNGGTKAVTLSEELPFDPEDGDKVHAAITGALDGNYLVDAVAAGGLFQWYVKRDAYTVDDDLIWTLEGTVASLKVDGLSRGALPTLTLDIQAANFRHASNDSQSDGLTNVALATPEGHAQLSMGTNVRCLISPANSANLAEVDANAVSFDVGMTRKPTQTVTERQHRFDGLASYSFDPGASFFSVTVVGYSPEWYYALKRDQVYRITLYQPGDGSGAGKAWCIHAGKARLIETPARTDVDMVHGVALKFQFCEPDDATPASNENLERSRFLIALG